MTSLLDIAAVSEKVPLFGVDEPLEVWGISARGIAGLMVRFPEMGTVIAGAQSGEFQVADIARLVPDAISVIIAMGVRQAGSAEFEAAADALSADNQLALLTAIMRLTVGPAGFAPFADRFAAMMGAPPGPVLNGADTSGKDPAGTSQSQ